MVQQLEFIIYTNIQPLRQFLLTRGEGQIKDSEKFGISPIFHVKLPMSGPYGDDLIGFPAFHR